MTEQQAMRMALEALETLMLERGSIYDKAIIALRQALEQQPADPIVGTKTWFEDGKIVQQELKYSEVYKQPADEPVAWRAWMKSASANHEGGYYRWSYLSHPIMQDGIKNEPLYTRPQSAAWVGLTDEEISAVDWKSNETLHDFARDIEAKLKDKNVPKA